MKAQRHTPGEMNKLEAKYSQHLDEQILVGTVTSYRFEEVKLKLADRTYFTPDFWLVMSDDTIQVHEVKGFWQDDARVKIKVAARQFQELEFWAVTWSKKDGWQYEQFGRKAA